MKVKFFPHLTTITKTKEIDMPAPATISRLLSQLSEKYGTEMHKLLLEPDNTIHHDMIIFLNGRHIEYVNNEASVLTDEDTVAFFSRIAGG